jgi:hypothetical protein
MGCITAYIDNNMKNSLNRHQYFSHFYKQKVIAVFLKYCQLKYLALAANEMQGVPMHLQVTGKTVELLALLCTRALAMHCMVGRYKYVMLHFYMRQMLPYT